MSAPSAPVAIIGAGWTGLAAAFTLQQHAIPCVVYESAPRPGGRARTVSQHGHQLDNGQHLLIGAYSETLRLLQQSGQDEGALLLRQPLRLAVWGQQERLLLNAPRLPAPLHLAAALLSAQGLPWGERLAALRMGLRLQTSAYRLPEDISVAALLRQHRQGERTTRLLWEPLCIATLNTPIAEASAQVFLNVLRDSFGHRYRDAELLLPRVALGELFAESLSAQLNRQAANTLRLRQRVEALHSEDGKLCALTVQGKHRPYTQAILATAPEAASRLLAPLPTLQGLAEQIRQLGSRAILTAYLHYPPECRLPQPMLGLHGGIAQWLTDRRITGQAGLIAVTISTAEGYGSMDNNSLCDTLHREIQQHFPHWPAPQHCQVIREKRATFDCRVGIQSLRPEQQTPLHGLWLAGDYTAGDYPATLEGAVRSGVQCAHQIIQARK